MTISVIMSVYNEERYVQEAIESVLAQTYRDFEFLVVDDCSTDKTTTILADLAKKDARIHIMTNTTNLGLTKSLNLALKHAQGANIARMDADDIALPERFEKQVLFLENNPPISVVGTAYAWIDEKKNVLGQKKVPCSHQEIHLALIRTNPFLHASVLIRKTTLDAAHGYNEHYKKAQDYDLWLRLSSTCQFANLPDVLMQKRMTRNMISFKNEREQIQFALNARLDALKRGDYPFWCAMYLVKPFLATVLPTKIVRYVRIHLFGQKIYSHPSLQ